MLAKQSVLSRQTNCTDSRRGTIMFTHLTFIVVSVLTTTVNSNTWNNEIKCCDNESVLDDRFECTKNENLSNESISGDLINDTNKTGICFEDGEGGTMATEQALLLGNNDTCVDSLTNGTRVRLFCNSRIIADNDTIQECDSIFTQVYFWGATMVVFATIIYNIPFIIVVIVYFALPQLRSRGYDLAVLSYHVCYMVINFLLIALGLYRLCHTVLSITAYRLFGLSLMFWTEGAVIWLLIICFDMTLVITRFRWAPKGGADRGREEKRKSLIYSAWGWGFASALTLIAAIAEFSPILPEDSPIRPNFHNFEGTNVAVIIYVITGPVLICLTNTCLFIYTTVKTIAVQKSTAIINENRKNNVKKRYFVFMKLYLLMDTPWFTSALGAIYPDLWILKFIKMIQPILIIILIVPRKRIFEAIRCFKGDGNERETRRLKNETGDKRNDKIAKKMDP